ncbi:unnamed protein product, partial [Amoebophrya sp. A120]
MNSFSTKNTDAAFSTSQSGRMKSENYEHNEQRGQAQEAQNNDVQQDEAGQQLSSWDAVKHKVGKLAWRPTTLLSVADMQAPGGFCATTGTKIITGEEDQDHGGAETEQLIE